MNPPPLLPLSVFPAQRILSARRGSSWPVVIQTPAGQFLTKLRGAAQGVAPLIAEIVVAELGTVLGLAVPERAIVNLGDDVPSDDGRDELLQLLSASRGDNLGFRFLPDAADLRPDQHGLIGALLATRIVWLDGLVMNPDRVPSNPNILVWHRQPWLIDHGAALPFHFDWRGVTEASPRAPHPSPDAHLLFARATAFREVDEECTELLSREALTTSVARVPDAFLGAAFPGEPPERMRASYVAFLWKRLKPPRPFVP